MAAKKKKPAQRKQRAAKKKTAAQRKRSAAARRGWETRRIIQQMYADLLKVAEPKKKKRAARVSDFDVLGEESGVWEIEVTGDIDTL